MGRQIDIDGLYEDRLGKLNHPSRHNASHSTIG